MTAVPEEWLPKTEPGLSADSPCHGVDAACAGASNDLAMASLKQLHRRREELQARLDAGDPSAETALQLVDRAISCRMLTVQHSRQRLEAVKEAVAAGVDKDKARRPDNRNAARKIADLRQQKAGQGRDIKRKDINRF